MRDFTELEEVNSKKEYEIPGIFSWKRNSTFVGVCFERVACRLVHAVLYRISNEIWSFGWQDCSNY